MPTVFDRLDPAVQSILDEVRGIIMDLDPSIIEQVRTHRIVYSKGFAMRDFAEIVIRNGQVVVTTIGPLAEQNESYALKTPVDVENLVEKLRKALQNV